MQLTENLAHAILKNQSLTSYTKRLAGRNWKDCQQELLLIIAEKSEEDLLKIQPYFNFWCVRTIRNMNGNSGLMKKYRSRDVDYEELKATSDDYTKRVSAEQVKEDLESLTFYEREMFNTYIEEGSCRAVSSLTQIPLTSVWETVSNVKFKLQWAQSKP